MGNHRLKTHFKIFLLCWLIIFCHVGHKVAQASSFSINLRDTLIDLKAEDAPLMDILRAISEKVGFSIKLNDLITEHLSINFSGISVEECIRWLLGHRNYVMIYGNRDDGPIVLTDIYVLQRNSTSVPEIFPRGDSVSPPIDDHIKKYQKNWFEREFGDIRKLSPQILAKPSVDDPMGEGIKIIVLQKNSFFEMVGLEEDDIISNVNGQPVGTVQGFIQAIQFAMQEGPSVIRIERRKDGRLIEPIYIKLQ